VVQTTREGTTVRYSIADPELFGLLDTARRVFEKRLAAQQEALETQPAAP
jgi:hypothetical protein